MTWEKRHFIVIDDNKLDCFIAEKIISNTHGSQTITSFIDSQEALQFITGNPFPSARQKNIILVDIQMPLMNGFEFVEAFEQLPDEIRTGFAIFMLSSTINETDINRVHNHCSVKDLLTKPLSGVKLSTMLEKL